jgi:hypothetical protein
MDERPVSMLFRVVDWNPAHVRVGVWVGRNVGARGKSGELVFRVDEWDHVRERLLALPDVEIEDGDARFAAGSSLMEGNEERE